MPRIMGREIATPWLVVLAALAAYVVYSQFTGSDDAIEAAPVRRSASQTKKVDLYTKDDYTVRYAAMNEPIRNSYVPLIVREKPGSSTPGGLPASFAAGDGNWVYSGMATVNGRAQGLLENRQSGDSDFVVSGQRWKTATIMSITAEHLTLSGPGGAVFTLPAGGPVEQSDATDVTTSQRVEPVIVPPGVTATPGGPAGPIPAQPVPGNGGRRGRRFGGNLQFGGN